MKLIECRHCMAVATGGGGGLGGLEPPPLWAGRSTLGDKFLRIISMNLALRWYSIDFINLRPILPLEYTTFFKIFRGRGGGGHARGPP